MFLPVSAQRHAENLAANRVQPPLNSLSPEFTENPYLFYARYRALDPVHWGIGNNPLRGIEEAGMWFVLRHSDVINVLKDARFSSEDPDKPSIESGMPDFLKPLAEMNNLWMVFRDPATHTRLRSLVSKKFTPQTIQKLAPRIEEITHQLLDSVVSQGEMEVMSEFAFPLPVIVIAELLGVPPSDRERFKHWSNFLLGVEGVAGSVQASLELIAYFKTLINDRRNNLGSDLISDLITLQLEDNDKLSEDELIANCILLLVAGHETTINLIGNGLVALLQNPEQLNQLRQNPQGLLENAVEEMLRFGNPAHFVPRFAKEDLVIAGREIKLGESIRVVLAAANHDPEVYSNPDEFDILRPVGRHSAFGLGIHFCLGAPLARLEGQIAFHALLERLPNLKLANEAKLEWVSKTGLRGLKSLPVTF